MCCSVEGLLGFEIIQEVQPVGSDISEKCAYFFFIYMVVCFVIVYVVVYFVIVYRVVCFVIVYVIISFVIVYVVVCF